MDYNWLLTTIAQSSAALVGISSGFLILRISLYLTKAYSHVNIQYQFLAKFLDSIEKGDSETTQLAKETLESLKNIEIKFPHTTWIGLIGILWLIYVLWQSVNQLSKFMVVSSVVQSIKIYFFYGLGILAFYLIIEVVNAASNDFINKKIHEIFKSKKSKKDKPKEN